eukprot:2719336-Alexandrium_andersonii.AAC.1
MRARKRACLQTRAGHNPRRQSKRRGRGRTPTGARGPLGRRRPLHGCRCWSMVRAKRGHARA